MFLFTIYENCVRSYLWSERHTQCAIKIHLRNEVKRQRTEKLKMMKNKTKTGKNRKTTSTAAVTAADIYLL